MKSYLFLSLIFISSFSFGQREFGVYDSTFHILNADTTIVAGRNKLYFSSVAGTTLIQDFTTPDDRFFIRDFDIINDSVWYGIVGNRYIGDETYLYKTADKGASWSLDTAFYMASRGLVSDNFNSLNQMQRLSEDTLVLFVGYYESGIVYSADGGDSWRPWFGNLIAYYHGLFKCGADYYLFGIEGDGFPSSMFRFADTLLFSPDTNGVWTHWTGSTSYHPACYDRDTACIFAPNSISRYDQYRFHRDYIDSICSRATTIGVEHETSEVNIFPNPVQQGNEVVIDPAHFTQPTQYRIYNAGGKLIEEGFVENKLNTSGLAKGLYLISFEMGNLFSCKKLIVN